MNYYLFNVLKGKFKIEFKKSVQYNDKRYVNTQHHIIEQNTIEICAKENQYYILNEEKYLGRVMSTIIYTCGFTNTQKHELNAHISLKCIGSVLAKLQSQHQELF